MQLTPRAVLLQFAHVCQQELFPKLEVVLDGVNIDVAPAESLVVIGGSGTGKSVLLKHVVGLLKPDGGTVEVDGTAVEKLGNRQITEFRRKFGMAFQEGALFDSMTVWQNVACSG